MKKLLIVLVLTAVLATGTVFADHPQGWGVGIVSGLGSVSSFGGGLSLKVPEVPIFWAIDVNGFIGSNNSNFGLGVTGDYYLFDRHLVDTWLGWYFGVGGFVWININNEWGGIAFGPRAPLGLSFQPISWFELFIEVAPKVGVLINTDGIGLWNNFFGGALGIRFWF